MIQHWDIVATGEVQGVLYRHSAKLKAEGLGIKGLVRNAPDGSINLEAEGEEAVLQEFLTWCHHGSENSKVKEVTSSMGEIKNYPDFQIVD